MKCSLLSRQRHDLYTKYHDQDSKIRDLLGECGDNDVATWHNRLPLIPDDEYIVVTETATTFSPPFNIGLGHPTIENFVFTRARYAPRVLFTGT
ncbi:MAG: hypothetical protein KBT65_08450 [Sulfitobacter sp.]|nr:hypothetical protein [Sulfitobacter sp.]